MTRLIFIHETKKLVIACECQKNESGIQCLVLKLVKEIYYWFIIKQIR